MGCWARSLPLPLLKLNSCTYVPVRSKADSTSHGIKQLTGSAETHLVFYLENPSSSTLVSLLTTQPYAECFPGRNFWLERFSPRNGFAWKFKDEACDFKKYHHGFLRRKQKCYFRSLDNKINRWVPTGDICLWQPKATVVAVCHKRPPHSVTVFTVRWFVLICSLKFLPWNFNVAFTSCFHK